MKALNKSILLFTCYLLIALVVFINIFNLVAVYKLVKSPSDSLSPSYVQISVLDEESSKRFLESIASYQGDVLIEKAVNYKEIAVYFNGNCFNPTILSGRNFESNDFLSDKKVVLIEQTLKPDCVELDGTLYYMYHNEPWEVVGVFQASENTINEDATIYFPMNVAISNNLMLETEIYYLDMDNNLRASLLSETDVDILKDSADITTVEYILMALEEQSASVIALVLIVFMILLNLFGVLKQWINGRKNLIRVMHIVGAKRWNIMIALLKQYYIVVGCAFIIAIPVAIIAICFEWRIFSAFEVSPVSIGISLLVYMCLSLPGVVYVLVKSLKSSISNGRLKI